MASYRATVQDELRPSLRDPDQRVRVYRGSCTCGWSQRWRPERSAAELAVAGHDRQHALFTQRVAAGWQGQTHFLRP